jgi:hypothetical protein
MLQYSFEMIKLQKKKKKWCIPMKCQKFCIIILFYELDNESSFQLFFHFELEYSNISPRVLQLYMFVLRLAGKGVLNFLITENAITGRKRILGPLLLQV